MPMKPVLYKPSPNFIVNVTRKHIDEAVECDGRKCMVVEAVIDSYKRGASYVFVDFQKIRFTDLQKGERYFFDTPRKIQQMLLAFDQGQRKNIKPTRFKLQFGQVRKSGYRACHGPDWKPQENRSSAARRVLGQAPLRTVAPQTRKFGLCLFAGLQKKKAKAGASA